MKFFFSAEITFVTTYSTVASFAELLSLLTTIDLSGSLLQAKIKIAKQAVNKLGIKSQKEYFKRFKEDPKLPSAPHKTYKDKGWMNWYDYFGKTKK